MKVTERRTRDGSSVADASGVEPYRVVDPIDGSKRMTVRTVDGDLRTVIGCADKLVEKGLSGLDRGATVRLELTPASASEGYVAVRYQPGSLPVF